MNETMKSELKKALTGYGFKTGTKVSVKRTNGLSSDVVVIVNGEHFGVYSFERHNFVA